MQVAAALLALLASALFAGGLVAQHIAASEHLGELIDGESEVRAGDAQAGWRALVRRPLWWAGNLGDWGAYLAQAAALGFGALLIVQPIIASSLLFALALGARVTRRPLRRADAVAALALAVAVAVFAIVANPSSGRDTATVSRWAPSAVILLVALAGALASAWRTHGASRASGFGAAVGLLYGASAVLTKTVVDHLHAGPVAVLSSWDTYALIVVALAGTFLQQLALASGPLSASLPAMTVLEPLVASALGVTVLHEHLRIGPGGSVVAALAAVTMVAAVWRLARSPIIAVSRPPAAARG
jgi:hypothetical protein